MNDALKKRRFRFWMMGLAFASLAVGATVWWVRSITNDVGLGPGVGFREYTGLKWPSESRIVRTGNSHAGAQSNGEYFLIFDVDPGTILKWRLEDGQNKWSDWKRGPIPGEIASQCKFGGPGVVWEKTLNDIPFYTGDEELVQLLSSKSIWYSARKRGVRWQSGDLMIFDESRGRVWISKWDR